MKQIQFLQALLVGMTLTSQVLAKSYDWKITDKVSASDKMVRLNDNQVLSVTEKKIMIYNIDGDHLKPHQIATAKYTDTQCTRTLNEKQILFCDILGEGQTRLSVLTVKADGSATQHIVDEIYSKNLNLLENSDPSEGIYMLNERLIYVAGTIYKLNSNGSSKNIGKLKCGGLSNVLPDGRLITANLTKDTDGVSGTDKEHTLGLVHVTKDDKIVCDKTITITNKKNHVITSVSVITGDTLKVNEGIMKVKEAAGYNPYTGDLVHKSWIEPVTSHMVKVKSNKLVMVGKMKMIDSAYNYSFDRATNDLIAINESGSFKEIDLIDTTNNKISYLKIKTDSTYGVMKILPMKDKNFAIVLNNASNQMLLGKQTAAGKVTLKKYSTSVTNAPNDMAVALSNEKFIVIGNTYNKPVELNVFKLVNDSLFAESVEPLDTHACEGISNTAFICATDSHNHLYRLQK